MFFSKGTPVFRGAIQIARFSVGGLIQPESKEELETKRKLIISPLFSVQIFSSEIAEIRHVPIMAAEGSGHFCRR
jgi:hypothetical protein